MQTAPVPDVGHHPVNTAPRREQPGGTVYITSIVNPPSSVIESNYHNNEDLGPPYDTGRVLIEPPTPADLVGTTLAVTPTDPTWGSTITVTAQITNESNGPRRRPAPCWR